MSERWLSDEEFERLTRRRPPPEALAWVAKAIGRGAKVASSHRLRGGSSGAMHAIDVVDRRGRRHALVLRRFIVPNWQDPKYARREANALELLRSTLVPSPRLVALDADARFCDVPALLMTRLPGRVDLKPRDMRAWLAKLAAPLPAIHAVRGNRAVQAYAPYTAPAEFSIPRRATHRDAWRKVLAVAQGPAPASERRFIHRDYHPANVLWQRGNITGIVDWTNVSMGPPEVDVAHCRINLVALYGVEAADAFLEAYSAAAGAQVSAWHPYRDAVAVMDTGFARAEEVYSGWERIGPGGLTPDTIAARVDEFVVAIARR
jgi:aminoglycoside phosphotransferase (APT) family kinase protein